MIHEASTLEHIADIAHHGRAFLGRAQESSAIKFLFEMAEEPKQFLLGGRFRAMPHQMLAFAVAPGLKPFIGEEQNRLGEIERTIGGVQGGDQNGVGQGHVRPLGGVGGDGLELRDQDLQALGQGGRFIQRQSRLGDFALEDSDLSVQIDLLDLKVGGEGTRLTDVAFREDHLVLVANYGGPWRLPLEGGEGERIELGDLPEKVREGRRDPEAGVDTLRETALVPQGKLKDIVREATQELERDLILRALQEDDWNVTHTARRLGISRKGLQLKMKDYGLRHEGGES